MKTVMTTKMVEGTPVQDHALKTIDSLNELEVLSVEINVDSHIDIILELLPDSFMNFKLNYNMDNMNLTMAELYSQLVAAEGILKDHPSAHMTEKSFARSKPKGNRMGRKKSFPKGQRVDNDPSGSVVKGSKGTGAKSKGKCFHYGMTGHWKWNFPFCLRRKPHI